MDHRGRLLDLFRQHRVLRPKDIAAAGIPRTYLSRLLEEGTLARPSRGLYTLADDDLSEQRTLVEASLRVPRGVVCLLSALQFHGLTTQAPFEIWLAIDVKARLPRVEFPQVRIVRFSGRALTECIETHSLEQTPVRVYSPAKTVADCFKYRHKIGLDVALEALRDCLRRRLATADDIWGAAKICRMTNVIRPYLESAV